jgi:hypothetical protein
MATNTYVALRTTTLSSSTPSVTLDVSGITGYTDLVIVASLRADTVGFNNMNFPALRFNGDSTSGLYFVTNIYERNGSAISGRSGAQNEINNGGIVTTNSSSGIYSPYILQIQNYASTSFFKTTIARLGGASNLGSSDGLNLSTGLWKNTNAITTISLTAQSSGNFLSGSTFTVYGIANARIGAPKAFGGTITQDANYTYHTFGASGTFTPQQSLTADCLVIGGGGGGGCAGGGGGAGSLIHRTGFSLTAQNYSITIGSGGAGDATRTAAAAASGIASTFNGISATGGGGGGSNNGNIGGGAGGSGGGGTNTGAGGTASAGTLNGGTGYVNAGGGGAGSFGSGGGGSGAAGTSSSGLNGGGPGGNGTNAFSSWLLASGTGVDGYIAGGGGGGAGDITGIGGLGGGGNSGLGTANGFNGTVNTGGGAGGSRNGGAGGGGTGGSGVVIIRYAN